MHENPASLRILLALGALSASACSDDRPRAEPPAERLYALQTHVYQPDDESTSSYVALMSTLDREGKLDLTQAREFSGYAFISAVGGKLLLSSGEEPAIIQYEVTADREWHETAKLSFQNQGVESYGAGFERHWFLNERAAYLTLEVTSRVVWDPTDMVVLGVEEDTGIPSRSDGLLLDATFNRPPRFYEGPVLKPFYYRDEDWFHFGARTPIAVYDPVTHAEQAVIDAPCPALEVMSQDEDGNTYFSPWTYGPALSLFGEGPEPCVVRVKSDSTLDEDWTPELEEWTGGRPVQVFRYLAHGRALGTVLHVDEVEGDFESGYDEDLALELDSHYRLWSFDLGAETARPIEAIASIGSGFNVSILDGRTFVFVPNEDWSETTVYELGADGAAEPRFRVDGLVNDWLEIH